MKFILTKGLFNVLKNTPEVIEYLEQIEEYDDRVSFKVKKEDIQEVQLLINDEIVLHGMNNQEIVNDLGLKLYKLYDEILYQRKNQ
ncbi:hypothetical protein [Clostridium butyricum]|uniref:hypothetical protein n=1 Tax=Clostridium butyricum TaxID=1492 RepID=UPI0013D288EA|nr:hypothetical protein [Clostridium butyricum]MCQ2017278.1 hypothetical protein [Clostridium butyricum]MCQ2021151.1 hypothetical protein [Clostridium butyricum]NFB72507.1 hypothetical protein [Clostridium butyricum]NFB91568.1 hypothetical protein [Clostridium butyricum]UTY53584.1 hypothetical protein HNS01_10950 [Clostridium butyricum]